ncbi:hypothetical protein GLYMA_18G121751v4 [Glycine max]|nr:hypothetical protein GLYMA_18G121751v4 [Glycine max]KAH1154230.1 hypothetical protein GYH30_049751 [Glycine max]
MHLIYQLYLTHIHLLCKVQCVCLLSSTVGEKAATFMIDLKRRLELSPNLLDPMLNLNCSCALSLFGFESWFWKEVRM